MIAIIPARGGSKRIIKKNIKPFHNKPIIGYTIDSAIKSQLFERVIVSTDDDEIASVAQQFGAEVPFKRPAQLADDHTGTGAVINHALNFLRSGGTLPDYVCCIYATAPFLRPDDLVGSFARLTAAPGKLFCFSVCDFAYPVHRSLLETQTDGVTMLFPEHLSTRSQDLPRVFHDAGQFYWGATSSFLEKKPMFAEHSIPYFLPRERVCDIDTLDDWHYAELMWQIMEMRK